jgi:hypothetical protein
MSEQQRWVAAAQGLETHRSGVLLRLVVTVVTILYLAWAILSPHGGGEPNAFALLLDVAQVFATLLALVGVAKFSLSVPKRSGDLTSVAVLCLVGVMFAQAYALWIEWRVMQAVSQAQHARSMWSMPSLDILDKAEQLPTIGIIAGVAGLISVLVILTSIASAGRELGDEPLHKRASGMMIAVVALAIAYGAIVHWMEHARSTAALIAVAAGLAIFGIIVLVNYVGMLSWAASVMRRKGTELPAARVVDG